MTTNFFNRLVSESESDFEDNEDSFATVNDQVESYQSMLSNVVTACIIPPSNYSSTDILSSNITGESLLESDISISKQRGKELKSLFKSMYADFYKAGKSS
jgi:hypothetical protein